MAILYFLIIYHHKNLNYIIYDNSILLLILHVSINLYVLLYQKQNVKTYENVKFNEIFSKPSFFLAYLVIYTYYCRLDYRDFYQRHQEWRP
jgi:hypothetical protein